MKKVWESNPHSLHISQFSSNPLSSHYNNCAIPSNSLQYKHLRAHLVFFTQAQYIDCIKFYTDSSFLTILGTFRGKNGFRNFYYTFFSHIQHYIWLLRIQLVRSWLSSWKKRPIWDHFFTISSPDAALAWYASTSTRLSIFNTRPSRC